MASAALAASPGDWTSYGRDAGGGTFLAADRDHAGQCRQAGGGLDLSHGSPAYGQPSTGAASRRPATETTPLEVDGVIYLGTRSGRVVALDAGTGKELWAYALPAGNQPSERGIAYWLGDGKPGAEIVVGTMGGGKLIVLNAKTGEPIARASHHGGILDLQTSGCDERLS